MYTRDSSFFFVSHLSQTHFSLFSIHPGGGFCSKVGAVASKEEDAHPLIPAAIWVGAGGRGGEGGDRLAKEGIREEKDRPLLLQTLVVGGMSLQPRRVCASLVLGWKRRVCCAGRRCPGEGRVVCRPLLLPRPIPSAAAERILWGDPLPVPVPFCRCREERGKRGGGTQKGLLASWWRCVISLGGGWLAPGKGVCWPCCVLGRLGLILEKGEFCCCWAGGGEEKRIQEKSKL